MSLLCEWRHNSTEVGDSSKSLATSNSARSIASPMKLKLEEGREEPKLEPLLCGWNHRHSEEELKLEKPTRSASEGQLLLGWNHSLTKGANNSGGDQEDGNSLLSARSSVRSMRIHYQQKSGHSYSSRSGSGRPSLHGNERWGYRRAVSQEPASRNEVQGIDAGEDGVVTYLGKEYSARDLIQRCRDSSNRSLRSSSQHSLRSLYEATSAGDSDVEPSPPPPPENLRSSFMRNLSLSGSEDKQITKRPQLSKSNEYRSLKLEKSQSCHHLTVEELDDQVDSLQVQQRDLQTLIDNPVDFAALKQTLKTNGAITNGLLQQGLHVFVHQHREKKLREHQLLHTNKRRRGSRRNQPRRQQSMPMLEPHLPDDNTK